MKYFYYIYSKIYLINTRILALNGYINVYRLLKLNTCALV